MSIQSNINQALGIGAALLSQTSAAEKVKETKALQRTEKGLTSEWEGLKEQERTFQDLLRANKAETADVNYYMTQVSPKMYSTGQALNETRAKLNPESAKEEIAKGYIRGVEKETFTTDLKNLMESGYGNVGNAQSSFMSMYDNKLNRLKARLATVAGNKMPKKEDNVSRFYKELGDKK